MTNYGNIEVERVSSVIFSQVDICWVCDVAL